MEHARTPVGSERRASSTSSIWSRLLVLSSALLLGSAWLVLSPMLPIDGGRQALANSGPTIRLSPSSGLPTSLFRVTVAYHADAGAGCDMGFYLTWDNGALDVPGMVLLGGTGCKGTSQGFVPYPHGYPAAASRPGRHTVCAVPSWVILPAGVTVGKACAYFTILAPATPRPTISPTPTAPPTPTPTPEPTPTPTPEPTPIPSPSVPAIVSPSPAGSVATATAGPTPDTSQGQGTGGLDPLLSVGAVIVGLGALAGVGVAIRLKASRNR